MSDIRDGLQVLSTVFAQQARPQDAEVLRYVLNLIHLESKLKRKGDVMDVLGNRIEQARHTASHFGYTHSNLLSNLASVYSDTISTLARASRSAVTQHAAAGRQPAQSPCPAAGRHPFGCTRRQSGGHRWQLIFKRKKVILHARELLR